MNFFYALFCVHPDIKRQFRCEMRNGFRVVNLEKEHCREAKRKRLIAAAVRQILKKVNP